MYSLAVASFVALRQIKNYLSDLGSSAVSSNIIHIIGRISFNVCTVYLQQSSSHYWNFDFV